METLKRIFKVIAIVVGALILAFLVLLGVRIASRSNVSKLDVSNKISAPRTMQQGMGAVEMGESFDSGLSSPSVAALPQDSAMPMRSKGISSNTSYVGQDVTPVDRKVMKDGFITAKVDNVNNAVNDISGIANRLGGEVASTNFYKNTKNVTSGTITVRVPLAQFDTAFAEIKQVATFVASESISGQDVTAQYVDLSAQLDNKKAEEQSLKEILENTKGKIEDVLAVTQELSRVRGEIEQLQGQMRYLDSQTDMASITVNISEDVTVGAATSWRPWQIVKAEFANMLKDMQKIIGAFIVVVIRLTPIIVFIILFFLIFFWIARAIIRSIFFKKKLEEQVVVEKPKPVETPAENPKTVKPRTRTIAMKTPIKRRVVKK